MSNDIEQARELLASVMSGGQLSHFNANRPVDVTEAQALTAIAAALRAAPEGFALVPVNPTVEMLKAGYNTSGFASATWKDMIAASKQIETLSTVTPPRDLRTKLGDA